MNEIRVIHDNNLVYGFEGIYEGAGLGAPTSGGVHAGPMNSNCINQSVALPAGTDIVAMGGRHGDVMDNITITLNNGQTYSFGGSGGNPFTVAIPEGRHVRAIAGGLGGHVHNVAVYY